MRTTAIAPARIDFDGDAVPFSPDFDDRYHPREGALTQARHVFLGGNGLPERWRGRARFTILETGFGLGNNFLATWEAWRRDAQRCERLHYIGIDLHPPRRADLARVHAASPLGALAEAAIARWPLATANLHGLAFEDGRVQLLLGWFDARDLLPEIVADVDAFYLDGFAPAKNPAMWERHLCQALGRIAAPGATAATWSVARAVHDGLSAAGFAVEKASGFGGKREMTVARFAPRFAPRRPAGRVLAASAPRRVAIVGGGLAGCALAWALAQQGVASRVFERGAAPAEETSGNAGGVFHGVVTPNDGTHARFNRAAALAVAPVLRTLLREHGVPGEVRGLLRLAASDDVAPLRALLDALGLPPGYVQALDAHAAGALAGLPLARAVWLYPEGGYVAPAALARALLACAGEAVAWHGARTVADVERDGAAWRLLDANGATLDRAEAVAICGNAGGLRLLSDVAGRWPIEISRGQTTGVPVGALGAGVPRLPIAGHGYVLPPIDGTVWCGATRDAGDDDAGVRERDQQRNLERLARLLGRRVDEVPVDRLAARVGWRLGADDRLPVIGALPELPAPHDAPRRLDQPRFVPRQPGLFVFTALASRGITWSVLGARTLAALIAGAPCPLEASLLDAVDAGRFAARAARRTAL